MDVSRWLPSFDENALPSRVKRLLNFGASSGLFRELFLRRTGLSVFRLLRKHGLSVRTFHAMHATADPNRLALVDDHRSLTYEQVDRRINRLARGLQEECGIRSGDIGMIMMENRIEYILAWFALLRLGASVVHASYGMQPEELEYQVEHSDSQIVFVSEHSRSSARAVQSDRDDLHLVHVDDDPDGGDARQVGFGRLIEGRSDAPPVHDPDSVSGNILYTSGTTGRPKGTVREFGGDSSMSGMLALLQDFGMCAGDRGLVVSPLYHGWGQASAFLHTFLGATLHLRPKFDAEDTLSYLSQWNINSIFLVPIMVRRLLNLSDELHEQWPLESLRTIAVSGAPFPQPLKERAIDRFGADVMHEVYAATELGVITHISGDEMRQKPGSSGTTLPGLDMIIADEQDRPLPPGEVGSIYVSHDGTMSGYLKNEEATREIQRGDWMTLDDLGYLDEDGYLHVTGRARDMVITGGVNVYPVEVEETLEEHPAVDKVAVFGVPDEEWGERLVAAVVTADDATFDPASLESFARDHLHAAKVPKEWHAVDDLPTTSTGKVLKRVLEEEYANGESGEPESESEPSADADDEGEQPETSAERED